MSSNSTHNVSLVARDGLSTTFRTVGASGRTAAIDIVGSFRQANAELAKTDAATAKAATGMQALDTRMQSISRTGAAFGAGLATLTGLLSDAARAAAEEQAGLDRLEQAVENTGESFDRHAAAIDKAVASAMALSFADDQAVDALNTLTGQTGSAARAIDLLSLSMDVSRARGLSLAQASELVGKVAQGNTAILSRYGIVLKEGATATEALATLQQRFGGQARTFADSQAGGAERVKNAIDNMIEGIGEATGEYQGLLLLLPGLTSGFSLLGGVVGGLGKAFVTSAAGAATFGAKLTPLVATGGQALGVLGPLAPAITAVGLAAAAATPLMIALAVAYERGVEAQRAWDEEQAKGAQFIQERGAATDKTIQDLVSAILTWNTVTTASINGVTVGLEDLLDEFLRLDDTSTQALKRFAEGLGGVSPDTIDQIAQEIVRLSQIQNAYGQELVEINRIEATRIVSLMDTKAATEELTVAQQNALRASVIAGIDGQTERWNAQADAIRRAEDALRSVGVASGGGFGAGTGMQDWDRQRAAVTQFNQERRQAEADAERAAEEAAADFRRQQDEAERLIERRNALIAEQAEVQRRAAQETRQIERAAAAERKQDEQALARELRGLSAERVDVERDTVRKLRDLEEERRTAAIETENQLRQLADERATIQEDLGKRLADAEAEWLRTSEDNLRAQGELRAELRRTTAEAARDFQQLQQDNLEQQQEVQEALRRSLQDSGTNFKRTKQDIQKEIARVQEDLALVTKDPFADPVQVQDARIDAERRLADLRQELRRAEQDYERERSRARQDAKNEEEELARERKAAAQEFHRTERNEAAETQRRIQDLERERQSAAEEFAATQAEARAEARRQLETLDARQVEILQEQARAFADVERQKKIIARDAAREREVLARQAAQAETQFARESAKEQELATRRVAKVERERLERSRALAEELRDVLANPIDATEATDAVKAVSGEIDTLSSKVTTIGRRSVSIRVSANTASFWATVNDIINRQNVGTVNIRIEAGNRAGVEAVIADLERRAQNATRGGVSKSSVGIFGDTPVTPTAPTDVVETRAVGGGSLINYGTIHVHPPNADVYGAVVRVLAGV